MCTANDIVRIDKSKRLRIVHGQELQAMQTLPLEAPAPCGIHAIPTHPQELHALRYSTSTWRIMNHVSVEHPDHLCIGKGMWIAFLAQAHNVGMSTWVKGVLSESDVVCGVVDS